MNNNRKSIKINSANQNKSYLNQLIYLYLKNSDPSVVNRFNLSSLKFIDLSFSDFANYKSNQNVPFSKMQSVYLRSVANFDALSNLQFGSNLQELDLS